MIKLPKTCVFIRKKPALILLELLNAPTGESYASDIARKINCTYAHIVKLLSRYEKTGIVNRKTEGRIRIIRLTKKGKKVATNLYYVIEAMSS